MIANILLQHLQIKVVLWYNKSPFFKVINEVFLSKPIAVGDI
jgi:hypothetical protein